MNGGKEGRGSLENDEHWNVLLILESTAKLGKTGQWNGRSCSGMK